MTSIPNAAPTTAIPQTPGTPQQNLIPGTDIRVPTGQGVERLIPVPAPFRMNAPPWYTPPGTVWSQMGCAVPQPGQQIQTNNGVIFDFNSHCGNALFDVLWKWSADRLMTRWPSRDCLWEMHQLLILGRNRLVAKTTPDGASPLVPTKATPAPKMFLAFPVPLYGPLGCVNQYLREFAELVMLMQSEAMQHSDNARSFYVTKNFFDVVYPYVKYLLVDMATKFFGVDVAAASDDKYVIPDAAWLAFDSSKGSVNFEATSPTPPLNYVGPTSMDLQNIKGLTYESVIPFLQPWPDAQYQMTSGGIWGSAASPSSDTVNAAGGGSGSAGVSGSPNLAASADPAIFKTGGPPTA